MQEMLDKKEKEKKEKHLKKKAEKAAKKSEEKVDPLEGEKKEAMQIDKKKSASSFASTQPTEDEKKPAVSTAQTSDVAPDNEENTLTKQKGTKKSSETTQEQDEAEIDALTEKLQANL